MKFKGLQLLLSLSSLLIGFPLCSQKVTIIGAGLAGLSTAHRLKKEGFDVEIYEARQRPGGRVFTCYFTNGYSELGGMNIYDGGSGATIKALADELNVAYHEYFLNRDFSYYTLSGDLVDYKNFFFNVPAPTPQLYSRLKLSNSIAEALDSLFEGTNKLIAKRFLALRSQGYEGCECSELSMLYFDSFWSYYHANYQCVMLNHDFSTSSFCTIKNGMRNLIEALCESLAGCIHYEMPLKRIYQDKNNELIIEVGDKQVTVDKIVLALPSSTLKDVIIEEGLIPKDQMDMINTLQYGTNAKILVPTIGNPTRSCGVNDDCFIAVHALNESPILWLYFGGKEGVFDSQTLQTHFEKQIPALKKLYPELTFNTQITTVPATTKPYVTIKNQPVGISWINEPYSKGSYSCLAPGQEKAYEQYSEHCGEKIRTVFRPIQNRIFFAGEHTSLDNPATMEGAVESGERAARMVSCVCSKK